MTNGSGEPTGSPQLGLRRNPGCMLWAMGLALLLGLTGVLLWWLPFGGSPGGGPASGPSPDTDPGATAMTVTVAATAGGQALRFPADDLVPLLQNALDGAGIGARDLVAGYYEGSTESQIIFQGGEHAEPLPEPELGASAMTTLDAIFAAAYPFLQPIGDGQEHDAGPLGGYVRCRPYQADGAAGDYHLCGWIDQWTFGIAYTSGISQDEAAAQLVAMRADLEVPASG